MHLDMDMGYDRGPDLTKMGIGWVLKLGLGVVWGQVAVGDRQSNSRVQFTS